MSVLQLVSPLWFALVGATFDAAPPDRAANDATRSCCTDALPLRDPFAAELMATTVGPRRPSAIELIDPFGLEPPPRAARPHPPTPSALRAPFGPRAVR